MKIKSFFLFAASTMAVAFCSDVTLAKVSHDWGSHGYFRFQDGVSKDGSGQEVFKAPGTGAKYRLGNENDNYAEIDLYDTMRMSPDGPFVKVEGMVDFFMKDYKFDYDDVIQLYIEIGDLSDVLGEGKVWFGRRYYDRQNIHINDYFFLNTIQGADAAGGITDIHIGPGKLALAIGFDSATASIETVNEDDSVTTISGPDIRQYAFDGRYSDITVNKNGNLMLWGYYTFTQDVDQVEGTSGQAIGIMHTQTNLLGGYNKFMIQYGSGAARSAGAGFDLAESSLGQVATSQQADDLEDAQTWRITNQNVIEFDSSWSMMTAFVYEDKESTSFDGTDQAWISVGARPMFYVNDNLRIPFEIGWDYVDNRANDIQGSLLKTTIAAEFALEKGFWTRPVIRLFGTYATWSDEFEGQIGGNAYIDETDGYSVGTQIEWWW